MSALQELGVTDVATAGLEGTGFAVPRGIAWQEYAVCHGRTKLFFAPKAERPQARARREHKARMLCTVCPVQVQCREFARRNHEYGYWGGESEEERHLAGFTISAPIGIRARQAS